MILTLIVAADEDGTIGKDGSLPWRLPADLAHFKRLTMGRPIIMGRRTWDSLGRALPGRTNIVLTRRSDVVASGATVVGDVAAALAAAAGADEAFVVGGAEIYALFHDSADRIQLTRVHARFDGDTHLPPGFLDGFVESAREERGADDRNACAMTFLTYQRCDTQGN